MDGKKKRNKKKKGNQGRNTGDATSTAEEAAPQSHNHDSAPKDHYSGTDADDAMSSVGEGIPQYQNHPQANQNAANADETISSVGQVIPCYENLEPTMTQENQKFGNTVYADQRSIGMSDSSVELDKDRLYEAKLVSCSVKDNCTINVLNFCISSLIILHGEDILIMLNMYLFP